MSTLVSAQGASFSAALTGATSYTYTSSTTFLSTAPVDGDYVFVALWLTRGTATTAGQNANGTYGSVRCGTIYLTCMENVAVPTTLSNPSTTNFRAWGQTTGNNGNVPNLAIFGAPYTSGMSRQIVVTGYNSSASTAYLLVTAMAVQGIYVPTSSPRTTWCNTISAGGVIDATSGSGLGWTSSGTPSLSSFGSTKVGSNTTSAIVDDVISSATTGVLNLGSAGFQSTQFSTRYANQQGLYTGTIDGFGFQPVSGANLIVTGTSNNPIPPDLSGGPSTYTGNAKLAVGQSLSGPFIQRDTYITGFTYDPNFLGGGPAWFIRTSQTQGPNSIIYAGTEQPVLAVMLTNNTTTTAANTSVGNGGTGQPANGYTLFDPVGSTMYVSILFGTSGVVSTSTNTALPTSGKMTVPTYGGNATMSWTSKPSSTSLAGCTIPPTPKDAGLYQTWVDITGPMYWDNTPVISNGSTQSVAPGIETTGTAIATGATGFQTGSLVMTYGANRSGINPVNLYGLLRSNGGTNYGFGAAFAFKPNKAAIIGTVSEVTDVEVAENASAGTFPRNSQVNETNVSTNASNTLLPRTSENTPVAVTENASATSKTLTGAVSEINTGETGGRSLNTLKTDQINETPSQQSVRALETPKTDEITNTPTSENLRSASVIKTSAIQETPVSENVRASLFPRNSEVANVFTTSGTTSRALSLVGSVVSGISTTSAKAMSAVRSAASNLLSTTTIKSASLIVRVSEVSEILYSTSQKVLGVVVGTNYTLGAMVARGGYIPTLNSILGYGVVGQEALGYGITNAINNWYSTTAIPRFVINYIETGAVNLLSTTENGKSLIRNLVSTVSETPKSETKKATAIARSTAVAETPTTTSQRSVARSTASAVAEILSSQNIKSVGKSVVGAVNGVASGENATQVARNLVSFVAIIASEENQTSKTFSRAASVFTIFTASEGKARNFGKASARKNNSYATSSQANSKSVNRGRNSEIAERPTTTSQRSIAHTFATAANLLIRSTVSRSVTISRASAVAQRFYTTAFIIILKISKGFIANFTEYSKTEGFTEYSKTEIAQDGTKTVFTTPSALTSFRDDGVASYTEGQ